ncbi:TraR/DksA family transcriptional regulator [Frigidibacter sp. ROC022]|uniref:TraR/DksA family transcriptional regulator n=1 Tax=Frigidibacter sp. ROC022 TaxID=2971796 RepID=UPI00215AE95A|nr:TraR/DksA family transcriptional regulator [Frigidibacter sp. ROC022]MCR8723239.1 TraR/DksA family transcriptional regulator [Frigidibacter sp. ROC022]
MERTVSYKRQLLRRLNELGVRLDGIERELVSHADPDWEDQATERESDEVLEALGGAGQREIGLIRAALDRIEKGTYGICLRCGEAISEDRLSALPATPLCRDCAREAES